MAISVRNLAILLYEQFVHHSYIKQCPKMQFVSTQQRAYQAFQVTSGVDSVCIVVTSLVN